MLDDIKVWWHFLEQSISSIDSYIFVAYLKTGDVIVLFFIETSKLSSTVFLNRSYCEKNVDVHVS